ncbi:Zn(2)-C6 fungal-type domain-containing protein [Mycena venus]|uniref:Zn(2)-C6 fungal-type domain-containing protein n=1 Tax=Mycena venus TaxID=2733690 RepID=A0A8H6Z2G1_9AGAR|nr:Zn(2)-C6 fungal-type domain-containing protein [Mycena venus]
MPVDKSKPPKANARRPQEAVSADYISQSVPGASGITHARELEVKRSRGKSIPLYLYLMRNARLKIKCDKQIPCQSCVRRGCSALCPNGALATGQGTRFVLAATEHLHRKIARMGERIRMLEDALTALHASKGGADGAVHPLLVDGEDFSLVTDDTPALPTSGARRASEPWEVLDAAPDGITPNANPDVIDAFGTLSISDHGISRFFGPTGGCESLLISNLPGTPSTQSASTSASPSSLSLSVSRSSQSLSPPSTHASAPDSPARPAPHNASFPHRAPSSSHSPYGSSSLMSPSDSPATLFSSSAFPLTPIGPPQAIHALVTSHLPPRAHARILVQSYFSQLAWLFRGVTRGQVGDMMRGVYAAYGSRHNSASPDGAANNEVDEEPGDGEDEDYTGPHDLALLFMIFAAGALVQPSTSPGGEEDEAHRQHVAAEAEHLHQIARVALALQPVLEKPSVVTIQALHLLSIYTSLASPAGHARHGKGGEGGRGDEHGDDVEFDHARGAFKPNDWAAYIETAHGGACRRRWCSGDGYCSGISSLPMCGRFVSLNTGRPPSFSLAYIDCSFPKYENEKAKDGACAFPSSLCAPFMTMHLVEMWQFRFAAECVADVTARTLTAEAPSYATIMELDRKVREFPLPPLDDAAPDDVGASLQRCVLEHIRETVLMYIHRSFFAQAIIEQPVNPLKSTYAPSFLAAYRASATILKSVREQFAAMPNACARFWTMWTFAFSAAVVFGTVVTRGPRSPLAAAAMAELEQACVLFSKAAVYSRRATKALGPGGLPVKVKKEEPDDELSIFAGHTRFVSGQIQRGQQSSLAFPVQQPPRQHQQQQQVHVRQQQQRPHGQMPEEMPYGSYEASPHRQYPAQYPAQQPPLPRQRQHSMPSSSSFHAVHEMGRPAPTVNVNVNMTWDSREYPQSAHDYSSPPSVMDERIRRAHLQQHQFYTPDESRMPHSIPPPPSAPYAWPVDSYGVEAEPQPQHSHHQQQQHPDYQHPHQQQQYAHNQGMYAHSPHAAAAYQAHNAELAQLGLAARDSRLDERWSTFMEDSGLLEGIDFRAR